MNTKFFNGLALLAAASVLPSVPLHAQNQAGAGLPAPAEVIARFLQASGGKDAVLKHESLIMKGKWEMPGMAQSGEFEILRAKPNRQLLRIQMADQGSILTGYDGKVGWTQNPFTGAMLLDGKVLEQAAEEAEFHNVLREEKNYRSMETVGKSTFDNKECIELKLVTRSGREVHEFFDTATGLLIGTRGIQESPQGSGEVTLTYSDYKPFGGVKQPTRLQVKSAGFEQVITISSVEYDNVPDKEFELPADVRALIKN